MEAGWTEPGWRPQCWTIEPCGWRRLLHKCSNVWQNDKPTTFPRFLGFIYGFECSTSLPWWCSRHTVGRPTWWPPPGRPWSHPWLSGYRTEDPPTGLKKQTNRKDVKITSISSPYTEITLWDHKNSEINSVCLNFLLCLCVMFLFLFFNTLVKTRFSILLLTFFYCSSVNVISK